MSDALNVFPLDLPAANFSRSPGKLSGTVIVDEDQDALNVIGEVGR